MEGMHILARLPRTGVADWPRAVAVATADLSPSGDDETLICTRGGDVVAGGKLRAVSGDFALYSMPGFVEITPSVTQRVIGCLPKPLG